MCGIFGIISTNSINNADIELLASHSRQRGKDSSGLVYDNSMGYRISRADYDVMRILKKEQWKRSRIVMGHSRLITNGLLDNQPVVRDDLFVVHNGIIVNEEDIWNSISIERRYQVDSEAILGIVLEQIKRNTPLDQLASQILSSCEGTVSAAIGFPTAGKLLLLSNNGSLYVGTKNGCTYFASEEYALKRTNCMGIRQLINEGIWVNIPEAKIYEVVDDNQRRQNDLIPTFKNMASEEAMLEYPQPELRRCTKCILPETMPFITFDSEGVCNYCRSYKLRNNPKPRKEIFELVEPYRRTDRADCIVPFSGGRDSCYGLHLVVNELKMRPITYTYDWGMVTDLGRRNISRMCSKLGVENIIVAANIEKKRSNIRRNLKAWLESPHLGMISILTAGDKHFFQHIESIKKQTGIELNLWGANPLEVTHFKAGFLGIKPDFEEKQVYMTGIKNQIIYQSLRFKAMLKSPEYFNSSLWDTLSGEYYRSFAKKEDYFHIFDYWQWDERSIDETLSRYDWERAPDTNTTWRIGDGTAAFYNYIYYTVAGFTEHDTFRSNQIREGQITRDEALKLVAVENRPRYQNIRWYLDAVGLEFTEVIKVINQIPRLY